MKLRQEFVLFLAIGLMATLVDLFTYYLLISSGLPGNYAKAISFILGTLTGYVGNTRFAFRHKVGTFWKYTIVYALSLVVNIWVNNQAHNLLGNRLWGWIIATGTTTTLNFLGLRHFTFKEKV